MPAISAGAGPEGGAGAPSRLTRRMNWASILEPNVQEQAERTAAMPFIYPHLALMPAAHPADAGCLSLRPWSRPVRSVRAISVRGLRPCYKITDVNAARADDLAPDAEGDVVFAAQPGQRMQNPRIGCA